MAIQLKGIYKEIERENNLHYSRKEVIYMVLDWLFLMGEKNGELCSYCQVELILTGYYLSS